MTKRINLVNAGFTRYKDRDFSDDGNYFRGYEYGGSILTYLRDGDMLFIHIDYDEGHDIQFTFDDWMKTNEYKLTGEFNGVNIEDFDIEKLKSNCIAVATKVEELNQKVKEEAIDTKPIIDQLQREIETANETIENAKSNFKWFNVSTGEYNKMVFAIKRIQDDIKRCNKAIEAVKNPNVETYTLRVYDQNLKTRNWLVISNGDYSEIKTINDLVSKSEKER